jgi:hypothetical protein
LPEATTLNAPPDLSGRIVERQPCQASGLDAELRALLTIPVTNDEALSLNHVGYAGWPGLAHHDQRHEPEKGNAREAFQPAIVSLKSGETLGNADHAFLTHPRVPPQGERWITASAPPPALEYSRVYRRHRNRGGPWTWLDSSRSRYGGYGRPLD